MSDSNSQPANKKARSVWQVTVWRNSDRFSTFSYNAAVVGHMGRLDETHSPTKKLPPESTPQVMFTGFEPTQAQQYTKVRLDFISARLPLKPGEARLLRGYDLVFDGAFVPLSQWLHALGGEIADSNQKVTHLVANKVTRTVKFLTAMSVVKHIVRAEWLEESWRSQRFVGTSLFVPPSADSI